MSSGVQPPAEYAFWRTPDAAITVVYSLALFHEIDFVVNEGYRRIPHGGVEVGVLLFGRGEASRIRIEAFRGIECEHAFGPSFVLSERDLDKLQTQVSSFAADPELAGLEPVGWLVAHSRSAFEMSDREASWFDRFFPEPVKVAVLAKPERFQPTRFAFVVRRQDGELQRAAATDAVILPLAGRSRGPQDGQSEDGLIPSLVAPATPPPRRPATPPEPRREVVQPVPPPVHQAMEPAAPIPEPLPPRPVIPPEPAIPEQVTMPFEKPAVPQAPLVATKASETPTRVVPSHGIETRPLAPSPIVETSPNLPEGEQPALKWPTVPTAPGLPRTVPAVIPAAREQAPAVPLHDETVEMPRIPVPAAREPKPTTPADEIWRQRVEALPLRPAPPAPAPVKLPQISREPGTVTRGLHASASARPRLAFMFLIAALLGCSVGYYAYLQLPAPVIPLTVRPQGGALLVSWPAAQTQHVRDATLQVGPSQRVLLSDAQRSAGEAAVSASGNDIKIELIAHHWPRDSRGIVRFVRSPATAGTTR